MSDLKRRIPVIIRKLDAARDALSELDDLVDEKGSDVNNCRVKLSSDLAEYADYLERATWWKSDKRR